jgi:hypothetical protein
MKKHLPLLPGSTLFELFLPLLPLANGNSHKWMLKNAFLNGELEEEVYTCPPPGYTCQENKVCRLRKTLYGLKQAPGAWFAKFHKTITQLNFSSSAHDSSLFTLKTDKWHSYLASLCR